MNKKILYSLITALILGAVIFFLKKDKVSPPVSRETEVTSIKETTQVAKDESVISDITPVKSPEDIILKEELKDALKRLPTLEDMKNLTKEEVHHTPTAIREGGKIVGQMLAQAEANPQRREETLKFFLSCAENADLATPVRAVCWKSLTNEIPRWKIFISTSDANVPDTVKSLAARLP